MDNSGTEDQVLLHREKDLTYRLKFDSETGEFQSIAPDPSIRSKKLPGETDELQSIAPNRSIRAKKRPSETDKFQSIAAPDPSILVKKTPIFSRKTRAAVLICIFRGREGELRVVLTKRSMNLSSHPGDVALPGGKMDEEDVDDAATALREAMEEIGLDPGLVRVVANLDPFISSNLLTVVPVVGLLSRVEDFKPMLNADEVDAIFDAPLEMFLEEDGRHECVEKEWKGWKYACHLFQVETEQGKFIVGGLTASILIQAASIIYNRPPSFHQNLHDFSQLQLTLTSPK